jgi:hypothetical protein
VFTANDDDRNVDPKISAVYIQAEAMRWMYTSGTRKPSQPISKMTKSIPTTGFFSSLYSSFTKAGNGASRVSTSPGPVAEIESPSNSHEITQIGVSLSILSASVQVNLDKKMSAELIRSIKKNPPSKMKFELIYVRLSTVSQNDLT